MAKQKKKRTKTYTGNDAARPVPTVVHRMAAVDRSPLGQWWFEHKRVTKIVAITTGVVLLIIWMIVELFRLV